MEEPKTRLSGKEFSPVVVRRYSTPVLHWVAVISDENLDSLDSEVSGFWGEVDMKNLVTIQQWRNFAGQMVERLGKRYQKSEGIAVVIAADKMMISSLYGDFMNHLGCRLELYSLIGMSNLL